MYRNRMVFDSIWASSSWLWGCLRCVWFYTPRSFSAWWISGPIMVGQRAKHSELVVRPVYSYKHLGVRLWYCWCLGRRFVQIVWCTQSKRHSPRQVHSPSGHQQIHKLLCQQQHHSTRGVFMRSIGLHGGLRLGVVIENVCYGGASLNNVVNSLSWNKHCMAIV